MQVLRDQGLGKYCDPEFVRAASREMQEAMDMTPEEFDEAAHRLLQAEQEGSLHLPTTGWGEAAAGLLEDMPRSPPERFTNTGRMASDAPMAPSRRRGGGSGGGPQTGPGGRTGTMQKRPDTNV